jgi:hypothetical protein
MNSQWQPLVPFLRARIEKIAAVLCIALGVFLICLPLHSQVNTGRISGAITDQSGGAIAGATVTVVDIARGETRPLVADAAGQYAAPNLTPGIYTVRAEFKGFKTVERQNIQVDVGGDARVDLTLQPGEQTQTVTVTESLPIVNTTNAQTGGTLDNQLVSNLPTNGRNYRWMVAYVPGVMLLPGQGLTTASTNGGGTDIGNFMVDGLYAEATYSKQSSVGGAGEAGDTTILPLDAIQEIALVINPKAEYGWDPGLTVSLGLKSGTNNIHGSAYAYGRDQSLDARNAFSFTPQGQPLKGAVAFEQWGGTVGGPIKKNKLFYFMGYESERLSIGSTFTETSPTTGLGAGLTASSSVPTAIAAINTYVAAHPGTSVALNNLSLNLAGCNYSNASIGSQTAATVAQACGQNAQGFPSLFNNSSNTTTSVTNTFPNQGGSDNGLGKLDYHLNDHHTLNGEYFFGQYGEYAVSGTAITQQQWREYLQVRTQMVRGVEIWTPNSNWLNEARVGLDHDSRPVSTGECTGNPLGIGATLGALGAPNYATAYQLDSNAPACGLPTITINGFTGQLGFANNREDFENDYQGADSLSYTHGTHQFKMGVDVRAESFMGVKTQDAQKGEIAFGASGDAAFASATPLEDFLSGVVSSESIKLGNPVRTISWADVGVFFQDDWRILPRVTLNLGVREEIETPGRDSMGLLGNFAPNTPTGMVQENQTWPLQHGFGPRLGVVWDLTGKGTTVVRAGAGVMYYSAYLQGLITIQSDDLSSVPTGATLYSPSGQKVAGTPIGNIQNLFTTQTPTTTTTGGVSTVTSNFIPWAINAPLFPTSNSQVCGNGLTPTGGGPVNPAPCNGYGLSNNFKFPQNVTWNLSVQHAFTNNLSWNVAYVGAHTADLGAQLDINQPLQNNDLAPSSSNELVNRPYYTQFPWFSKITYDANVGNSNYAGLQTALVERTSQGLTFNIAYTLAHAVGMNSGPGLTTVMNSNQPTRDYGNLPTDVRDHFTITASYAIPGRKAPLQLLQGWELNSAVSFLSALPINAVDTSFDTSGTGEKLDRWTLYGAASNFDKILGGAGTIPCYGLSTSKLVTASGSPCTTVAAGADFPAACITAATNEPSYPGAAAGTIGTGLGQLNNIGCYSFNGSAIVPPSQGTFGLMGFDELRARGERVLNLSLTKDFKIKERLTAQFRAESFNLLNRTQYATPSVNLGAPSTFGLAPSTPDVAKNNPVVGSGGPRAIQLALKLIF